jgi:hypothetical protein
MSSPAGAVLRKFLFPGLPTGLKVSPEMVERALKKYVDVPVRRGDRTLVLRRIPPEGKGVPTYFIEEIAS